MLNFKDVTGDLRPLVIEAAMWVRKSPDMRTDEMPERVRRGILVAAYCGFVAYSYRRNAWIPGDVAVPSLHVTDADCTRLDDNGACLDCGIAAGEPCEVCEGRRFHADGCLSLGTDPTGEREAQAAFLANLTWTSSVHGVETPFSETVVRFGTNGSAWLMNRKDRGWGERGQKYESLTALAHRWRLRFTGVGRDSAGAFLTVEPLL